MVFKELIPYLEAVDKNPIVPLIKGRFVKWDDLASPGRYLLSACPLTQAALKAGLRMQDLQAAEYPADVVCYFLAERFSMNQANIEYVWQSYDNGSSIPEIITQIELELGDE